MMKTRKWNAEFKEYSKTIGKDNLQSNNLQIS